MSFRFHRGPAVVTLFHDSSSTTSKQVLALLSSYNARRTSAPSTSTSPSHGESDIVEAHTDGGGGMEFLRQAAAETSTHPIQLEVVDRQTNPPTSDQMRSIVDYLALDPTSTPHESTSGFDVAEHERRKKALAKHMASDTSGMPKIKDGPLVVNWDEGFATTTLEGVHDMLNRLSKATPTAATAQKSPGGGCTIC